MVKLKAGCGSRTLSVLVAAGVAAALCALALPARARAQAPSARASAQSVTPLISTDQGAYRVGDPLSVCYTVAGAGAITITDTLADGTMQTYYAGMDDGTGGCLSATVTPPAGAECLSLTEPALSDASAQACFEVIDPTLAVQPCGTVSELNGGVSIAAHQAEDCFLQAYQACTPATLVATLLRGLDMGTTHRLAVQPQGGNCTVTDTYTAIVGGPGSPTTVTCSGVTEPASGLLVQSCGAEGDVLIPNASSCKARPPQPPPSTPAPPEC